MCSCLNITQRAYLYPVKITRMKTIIQTQGAPAPIGPYSQAVKVNGTLYISGQIAIDPATGSMVQNNIQDETRQVMNNILAILNEAGLSFGNIIKTCIFLRDMNDFSSVNEIYGSCFEKEYPARETVQVSRLPKDANVEISVIAYDH